jgi:hypothetical protein
MLGLTDQIEGVNERQLDAGNLRVAALFSGFRTRLSFTLAVTLAWGGVLRYSPAVQGLYLAFGIP